MKPRLGISPQKALSKLQPGQGWARGAGMLRSQPREALLPSGTGTDPEATNCKATCFPSGRRVLTTSLMSQMERAAQESPEPGGCLPAAPLQPKWKNIRPR